jgi:hypothetical protein
MKLTHEYLQNLGADVRTIEATVTDTISLSHYKGGSTDSYLLAGAKVELVVIRDTVRQMVVLDNMICYEDGNVRLRGWISESDYDKLEVDDPPIDRTRALKLLEKIGDDDFVSMIADCAYNLKCEDCILRKICSEDYDNGCYVTLESYLRGEING